MSYPKQPIIQRFNSKYVVDPITNCWNWTAATNGAGYGYFANDQRIPKLAHRVSYELFKGPIPDNICVCHTCDNSICVNPNHLFLSNHQGNMDDKVNKNRQTKGETNAVSKLTELDVIFIRAYPRHRGYQRELANQFDISQQVISRIINNKLWKYLG